MTEQPEPCPFCGENLRPDAEGFEHPWSDTCPICSVYVALDHVPSWNTRHHSAETGKMVSELRAQLAAANARAEEAERENAAYRAENGGNPLSVQMRIRRAEKAARDKALVEAKAAVGLVRVPVGGLGPLWDAMDAILELRDKPAPAVPLADLDQHSRDAWAKAAEGAPPTLSAALQLSEVQALKEERDAVVAAYWRVRSYAVHDDDCTINRYPNRDACSCGLRAALATIKGPKP